MTTRSAFRAVVDRAAREHIPLDVSLELTWRCNFRCAHCYIPDFQTPDGLSTGRILRLLDELAEMGTLFLALTGGEPLLRRDWETIARRGRELGFLVTLLTNGALVDHATAATLAGLGVVTEVSFHSADPGVFDRVTGKPGSFHRVLSGVRRLRDAGCAVELTTPVSRLNPDGASGVSALARELGVECRTFTKIFAAKDGGLGPLQLRLPEEEVLALQAVPATDCHIPEGTGDHPAEDGPPCAAGVRYANVTASGEVLACNVLPGSAGNLNERSFREIWEDSPWFATLRGITARDLPVCSTCSKLAWCGRCHAQALVEDGDLLGPSRAACDHAAAVERAVQRRA